MKPTRSSVTYSPTKRALIYLALMMVLMALVTVAFNYYHARQAKAVLNSELSTKYAPQLNKLGVSSIRVSPDGLMFVAGGTQMCLINFNDSSPKRYKIVEIAEKAGCGPDSRVMQLDHVQGSMFRGFGASFVFLRDDEFVSADQMTDGKWVSNIDLKTASASTAERAAYAVMEDIEGFYSVLRQAPGEPKSPAALQELWAR